MDKLQIVEYKWLQTSSWRVWTGRRAAKTLAVAAAFLILCLWSYSEGNGSLISSPTAESLCDPHSDCAPFSPLSITGFSNTGNTDQTTCDELRHQGEIQVQQSFHLDDDIIEIAESLKHHPMIVYDGQDPKLTHEQIIRKTWLRLAQSSVWLEKYGVFLTVTRVMFYDKGVKHWPIISFIRAQIYDNNWVEQRNHTIHWQGEPITFPTIFNIPTPYEKGGGFYGPEDPRIIIEDGVDDAEPVIIFNMMIDVNEKQRAMHMFRPFSNVTTIFSINGQKKRPESEKNWMPFFHRTSEITHGKRYPNRYLHFVHTFKPLTIMKCHLLNGWCDLVFKQEIPPGLTERHKDRKGRMSGGTNFVSLNIHGSPGVSAYIGIPRTHIDVGCTDMAMYRPELMIMTAYGSHFHLDYLSDSIDFGTAAMDEVARADPCGAGRILIANSIAKWDRSSRQDIMTLSFTVDDSTTQVLRLSNVRDFVKRLPHLGSSLEHDISQGGEALWNSRWAWVGNDVLACSVEAAQNYSITAAAPYNGTDLRKQREKAEEQERERLKKEEEEKEEQKKKLEEERKKTEEALKEETSRITTGD